MRFVIFLLSLCFFVLGAPVRRETDALSLISALDHGLQDGQITDITSTSQSLALLPTTTVTSEVNTQIAIKTVSVINLALDKNLPGLKDLVINVERCVPGVDKYIYKIMSVGTTAKLRASGSSRDAATVLNQAELKVSAPDAVVHVGVGV